MQTSILIPTFNRQKYLKRCLQSIQKHTTGDYEILFVHTGMMPDAADWLQDIVRDTANCHLIETRDRGYAASLNQTINDTRSDFIVLMHNDVIVTDQWLTGMLDLLAAHRDIGCVGPMSDNVNGIQTFRHPEYIAEIQFDSFAAEFRMRNRHRRLDATRLSDVCVGMHRINIEQIGGFDVQFSTHDVIIEDICLRMRLEGFRNAIAGDVLIYHANGHKTMNVCDSNYHCGIEDRKQFTQKWSYLDLDSPAGRKLLVLKAIEKGMDRHHAGHTRQALEILSEGIRYAADDSHLAIGLASALADVGHDQQALDLLSGLCDSGPEELQLLELIGYCQYGLEDFESAGDSAERLLTVLPDSAAALNLKGLLEYRRGNKQSAANLYQMAIASDPGYGQAHTNLGILKQESGQISEAIELFEKGVILSAADRDAAVSYHSAIASQDAYDRAETVLREAVALHPHHKQLIYYLIDVLLKAQNYHSAMEYIKLAVARFGVEDGILDAALAIHPKVGPKTIEPGLKKHATVSLCMITKNEEAHLAKCLRSADAIADEIVVIDTGSTDRTRDIATVFGAHVDEFEWTNDFSAARNVSLAKASGDWILVLDADEVISKRDYEKFYKLLSHADPHRVAYEFCTRNYTDKVNLIGWKPNDGLYVNEEAGCGWTASDKVRLFPNQPELRFKYPVHELVEPSLMQKRMAVERCSIPIHHYGKLNQHSATAKMMPYYRLGRKKMTDLAGAPGAIRELAVQAAVVGNHREAVDLWKRFIALQPNNCDGYVNIGASYTQLNQYEAALSASQKALSLDPRRQEARYNYGISQFYLGRAGEALNALETILVQHPDYLPAAFMLSAAHSCCGMKSEGVQGLERLKKTAIGGELPFRCLDLVRALIKRNLMDYAILMLEAAVESRVVSEEASSLLSKIRQLKKTADESEIKAPNDKSQIANGSTSSPP